MMINLWFGARERPPLRYNILTNEHGSGGWFPVSNLGPTSVHLISNGFSLHLARSLNRRLSLFRFSLEGIIYGRDRYLEQFGFCKRSSVAILQASTSCLCFFDGKSPRKDSKNDGSSSKETSSHNSFLQGRWTTALLAINVLFYVLQLATKGKMMLWGAKINSRIDEGQLWRLLTSSFLHANIGHLMVNCYSLNSVGPTVEKLCGTRRFFTIYFSSAVASSTMSYWLCRQPAVGASGAIFGLVGSIAVFCLRHRNLLGSGAQDLHHIVQVIIVNLIIGLSSRGIDNWGHLGGLLGGAAVSWLVGPAWTYDSTTWDGGKVFVDRAPISFFTRKSERLR